MSELTTLTAQPRPMTVDGETYMVHPFTLDDWGELQAWLDRQHPDPFEIVKAAIAKGGFTVAQQQFMIKEALEKAARPKCKIGTVEADELTMSMEGMRQVLYLSIRKGRPGFTEADAAELAVKLTNVDVANLAQSSTLDMLISDPKSEPPGVKPPSKTSGPAASARRRPERSPGGPSSTT
jgi:hypothetical protein